MTQKEKASIKAIVQNLYWLSHNLIGVFETTNIVNCKWFAQEVDEIREKLNNMLNHK